MNDRKSSKGNLDKRRITFLLIGFVIVFGLVYAAFELFATKPKDLGTLPGVTIIDKPIEIIPTDPTKPPPPPAPQQDVKIIIVPDTQIIIDSLPFIKEYDPKENVPEYEPVVIIGEKVDDPPLPTWKLDELPEPVGGRDAMYEFLRANLKYPKVPLEAGIQGTVQIEFVVEKDGSISNVKVLSPLYPDLDNEATRVVKAMPKWKPGIQMGKPVRCMYNIPIRFAIR